ncbi:TIGR04086 family membrane protein [Desulfitobacterium metallireducens]|uniref:Membrane protein n=1 Tax=Desulfitobacterium metallireducens DSM 15288 TaxID=871968 RepID=W0E7L9_9FIRM|nr:TIGR04086 family membrane protein [Desulfitobacterium metallireducens]AHF06757.1 membrane protein [Desulfitobacterium metallireducens DSM 15288]
MPKSFKLSLVVKGILISALFALILSLLFSLILTFTRIPESELSLRIIYGISVFFGAALTSYQSGTKGLYYGLAVGVGFILFLLLVSAILISSSPAWLGIGEKTVISLVWSAIGGVIGAILKR